MPYGKKDSSKYEAEPPIFSVAKLLTPTVTQNSETRSHRAVCPYKDSHK